MSQLQNVRNAKKQDPINRILFSKKDDYLYDNLCSIYGTLENLTNVSLYMFRVYISSDESFLFEIALFIILDDL